MGKRKRFRYDRNPFQLYLLTQVTTLNKILLALALSLQITFAQAFGFWQSNEPVAPENEKAGQSIEFGSPELMSKKDKCAKEFFDGKMPVIQGKKLSSSAIAGCFDNFSILYSPITKAPIISGEHLTRDSVLAASRLPRINSFHPELLLQKGSRAELKDFIHSHYDRGHMAPNKDMPTVEAQWQCFSLANMIAQDPNNNEVLWEGIEAATRTLAKKTGELYVITGPVFIGSTLKSLNGVLVPTHVFKAVLNPKTLQVAAYLAENKEGMDYKEISIESLNKMTGLDLFPSLSVESLRTPMSLPAPTPHRER